MNKLRTKCFLLSACFHGLLGVALVVGSGFLGRKQAAEALPVLTFIPSRLVDSLVVGGGGSPTAKPAAQASASHPAPAAPAPAPAPAQPIQQPPRVSTPRAQPKPVAQPKVLPKQDTQQRQAKPKPKVKPQPEPEREPAPEAKREESVDPPKAKAKLNPKPQPPPKKAWVEPDLKVVTRAAPDAEARKAAAAKAAEAKAAEEAAAYAAAVQAAERALVQAVEARRRLVAGSVSSLRGTLSTPSVAMEVFGPGGETYANYALFVRSKYDWAWQPPEDIPSTTATVRVKVVIARDGTVVSSTILSKSGVSALDKSVKDALDRVESIGFPFPEGAKDDQRVFLINFNLESKRSVG